MGQLRNRKASHKLDDFLVKIEHSGQARHGSDWDQSFDPCGVAAIQPAQSNSDPNETVVHSPNKMWCTVMIKPRTDMLHGAPHPPSNDQSLAFLELADVDNRPKAFSGQSGASTWFPCSFRGRLTILPFMLLRRIHHEDQWLRACHLVHRRDGVVGQGQLHLQDWVI